MKFSEITAESWAGLQAYLDTCLLPVTGLRGTESPWETTEALEQLRDWLDPIEGPFRGRVVTYPAAHYLGEGESICERLDELCRSLKQGGFRYVAVVAPRSILAGSVPAADLIFGPMGIHKGDEPATPHTVSPRPRPEAMAEAIRTMWRAAGETMNGNEQPGQP